MIVVLFGLSSCGDMLESQLKQGKYTIRYSDTTLKPLVESLAQHLDSTESPFTEFRLNGSAAQHHYRMDIAVSRNGDLTDERRAILASTIARGYSRKLFNGDTCTIYLYPSLTPKARFHTTGTSVDPRLDSLEMTKAVS